MNKKSRLGRGIDALIPPQEPQFISNSKTDKSDEIQYGYPLLIPIENLAKNTHQPRRDFNEKDLASLAQSIKQQGVIEPLVVTKINGNKFEIIAGERRLRAAKIAGLTEVPVIIRELTEEPSEKLVLALVENLCREDLNPIEEAESFSKLEKEFGKTHQEIATLSGRERPTVTNAVRLLKLPDFMQDDIRFKRISAGHGRAILALSDWALIQEVRTEIILKKLTVRQTESLIKKLNKKQKSLGKIDIEESAYFESLSKAFSEKLGGLKVKINNSSNIKKMEIFYNNNEELEFVMKKIGVNQV
ncbi:MAG: ParB/RepB/Spo0J family partition protein [Candidatus Adiutrix sp.]